MPLDFGNDLKAAATDAKKKCASELGLFADVYSAEDFFQAEIVEAKSPDELKERPPQKARESRINENLRN